MTHRLCFTDLLEDIKEETEGSQPKARQGETVQNDKSPWTQYSSQSSHGRDGSNIMEKLSESETSLEFTSMNCDIPIASIK